MYVSLTLLLAVTVLYAGYNLLVKVSSSHVPAVATTPILATIALQVAAIAVSGAFAGRAGASGRPRPCRLAVRHRLGGGGGGFASARRRLATSTSSAESRAASRCRRTIAIPVVVCGAVRPHPSRVVARSEGTVHVDPAARRGPGGGRVVTLIRGFRASRAFGLTRTHRAARPGGRIASGRTAGVACGGAGAAAAPSGRWGLDTRLPIPGRELCEGAADRPGRLHWSTLARVGRRRKEARHGEIRHEEGNGGVDGGRCASSITR